ncbi:MAG: hypothetical protein KAS81_00215 [Anaerolineales bacterium]|nr:hypothetical protein [Anaerolineales bacterium]
MSSSEKGAANRRLRNLAIAWIIGSLIVACTVGAIIIATGDDQPTQKALATAAPASPLTGPGSVTAAPTMAAPQVVTLTPAGGASGDQQPAVAPVPVVVPLDAFGYGIQVHGSVGDPESTVGLVERLGLGWLKQQVRWGELEKSPGDLNWGLLDGIMMAAETRRIRVMLSVVTAPAWSRPALGNTHGPPDDLSQLAAFLGKLIDQYPGQISAIEVWNEQNLDREWQTPDGLSAERYTEMLRVAHETIKGKDPSIVVISGALAPTGGWVEPDGRETAIDDFVFFQQLLDAGMLGYADCVGAHHNGYNIGPDVLAEDAPNDPQAATAGFRGPFANVHHSWSFKSTLMGYSQMMAGEKQLCVTEFGWASTEGRGGTPPGFDFADDNSQQEQADWIVQAYQLQRDWGITWLTFLWNLDYGPKGLGPEDDNVPYSILNLDGSPRPAFEALETMPKP